MNFSVAPGRAAFVLGPNGSGKTTLLRILASVLAPDEGEARWDGERISKPDVRRKIGWLDGSDFGLDPRLTVGQNLAFFFRLYASEAGEGGPSAPQGLGGSPTAGRGRAAESLGLSRLMQKRVEALSAGEKRRAAAARALVAGPRLLLLDEPTRSLDSDGCRRVMDAVRGRLRAGCCAVATGCRPQDRPPWASRLIRL